MHALGLQSGEIERDFNWLVEIEIHICKGNSCGEAHVQMDQFLNEAFVNDIPGSRKIFLAARGNISRNNQGSRTQETEDKRQKSNAPGASGPLTLTSEF